jgi:hypothetical protein
MSEFREELHPREPAGIPIGGRFTVAPGTGGRKIGHLMSRGAKGETKRPVPNEGIRELFERVAKPDGGFTYQPVGEKTPKSGFVVSPFPDRSAAFKVSDFRPSDLMGYYAKHRDVFRNPGHYLGAWHDKKSGMVFLDISVVKNTRGEAARTALAKDQIAYFDLGAMKSVTVNRNATSGGVAP